MKKSYLIGKTVESCEIFKQNLLDSDDEVLLICNLSKVGLMEYTSDGFTNFALPKKAISFNNCLNKRDLPEDLEDFFNTNYSTVVCDEDDAVDFLKPIDQSEGDDSDEE